MEYLTIVMPKSKKQRDLFKHIKQLQIIAEQWGPDI